MTSPRCYADGQTAGFTIVAERLNYFRFLAHFRSIHRGAFFAQLRTTTVRKLLPDQWGFLCPVHTPDGSPCGLLSHLAEPCSVAVEQPPRGSMRAYLLPHLAAAGVALLPLATGLPASSYLPVLLDGEVRRMLPPACPELYHHNCGSPRPLLPAQSGVCCLCQARAVIP